MEAAKSKSVWLSVWERARALGLFGARSKTAKYRAAALGLFNRHRGVMMTGNSSVIEEDAGAWVTMAVWVPAEEIEEDGSFGRYSYERQLELYYAIDRMREEGQTYSRIGEQLELSRQNAFAYHAGGPPYPRGQGRSSGPACLRCTRLAGYAGLCPSHYAMAIGIIPEETP